MSLDESLRKKRERSNRKKRRSVKYSIILLQINQHLSHGDAVAIKARGPRGNTFLKRPRRIVAASLARSVPRDRVPIVPGINGTKPPSGNSRDVTPSFPLDRSYRAGRQRRISMVSPAGRLLAKISKGPPKGEMIRTSRRRSCARDAVA